jgi:hypothetical protein
MAWVEKRHRYDGEKTTKKERKKNAPGAVVARGVPECHRHVPACLFICVRVCVYVYVFVCVCV